MFEVFGLLKKGDEIFGQAMAGRDEIVAVFTGSGTVQDQESTSREFTGPTREAAARRFIENSYIEARAEGYV